MMHDGAGGADLPACPGGRAVGLRPPLAVARRAMRGAGEAIAERLGLPEIVGRLLAQRGVGIDRGAGLSRAAPARPAARSRRICATWTPPSARLVARRARRRDDRRVRRLRCRRRDLGGVAAAVLRGDRRARLGSMSPTGCARATARTRRLCCACKAEGAAVVVTVDCGTTAHRAAGRRGRSRARRHRRRSSRRRAAAAARARGGQSEPARRDQPARRARGGRRRLSAGRRASTARCAQAGWYGAAAPSPTCCNGSIWWRSARCAMSCR